MREAHIDTVTCRGAWAVLEKGGPVTLDRLAEATGLSALAILPYLDLLVRRGYVRLCGVQNAVGGETICVFVLVKRTGRDAPFVDESGIFIDPNQRSVTRLREARKPSGNGLFSARMRIAADGLGTFTRDELLDAAGISTADRHSCEAIWRQWKSRRVVIPVGGNVFAYIPPLLALCVQDYLRSRAGTDVSGAEIRENCFTEDRSAATGDITMAVNLLRAEGVEVQLGHERGGGRTYRVEAP